MSAEFEKSGKGLESRVDQNLQEILPPFEFDKTDDNVNPYSEIYALGLSVRSYNCLSRASIKSIRQLYETPEDKILKLRNLGNRNSLEIKQRIDQFRRLVLRERQRLEIEDDTPVKLPSVIDWKNLT